jgi:plastocyanin
MRLRLRQALGLGTGSILAVAVLQLGPAGAADHTVQIKGLSFIPEELAVAVGDKVTWVNEDDDAHDLQSDVFDAPPMQKGESFSFTFDENREVPYSCKIHTYMRGRITVGDGTAPEAGGESPPPTETPTTAGPTTTTARPPAGPLGLPVPLGAG